MSSPGSSAVIVDSPTNPPTTPSPIPAAGPGTPDADSGGSTPSRTLPTGYVFDQGSGAQTTPAPAPTAPPYGSVV